MKYIFIKEQIYNIINQYVDHYKIIDLIMSAIDFDSSKHNNEISKT